MVRALGSSSPGGGIVKIARAVGLSRWLLVLLAAAGGARAAEFQVNQYTTSSQKYPTISHDSSGRFVVAWASDGQDGSSWGVFGRRFDSSGSAIGGEFQVNVFTPDRQLGYPMAISHESAGGFVVAWHSLGQDGSSDGVFARRFDSSGSPLGAEFQVNQYTTSTQARPTISHDAAGGFVVAWQSGGQDGDSFGVFGRRFDSSGSPLGMEFQVNQYTLGYQAAPTISHDSSGRFVVAWSSVEQDGSGNGAFGRRFDSLGGPLGAEFQVNQYTTGHQNVSGISHDSSGGFVTVLDSYGQDGSDQGVFARRFDSAGSPLGVEFLVNQYTSNIQKAPSVSHDSFGGFVVAWTSNFQDGSSWGVFGRRFNSSGSPLGGEFQVNQYTPSSQLIPTISHDSSGAFVVAWFSDGQDGSTYGIFARRFPVPTVVIDDDLVTEGQSGFGSAIFLVLLSEPPEEFAPLDLDYATADATASAGSDYTATAGTLSILTGQTWGFITVPVSGDTLYEADEAFLLSLSTSDFANIVDPTALGAIFNDDDPPSLLITDVQIIEGNSGTSTAQFAVSISEASGLPARVDFSTFDGTATAGEDYTTASGTLIFSAMSTASQTASVLIQGDLVFEPNETFLVQLTQPVDATVGDGLAVGTILNDDGNFLITSGAATGGASRVRRYQGG